jgi:hypothetical protein
MEHIYENQQPNEVDIYEDCIHVIAKSFQNPNEIAEQIKQFGARFSIQTPEDREVIGYLMNGVIAATPEIVEVSDPRSVSNAFIQGAITGLYVGDRIFDGYVSTKDIFATSLSMVKDGPREFHGKVLEIIGHMGPKTRRVLDSWRVSMDSESMHGLFFELGFGTTMTSVNRKIYEIDLLHRLDSDIAWDTSGQEVALPIALQSLDEICLELASAFQVYGTAAGLDVLTGDELRIELEKVTKRLEIDLAAQEELLIDDEVQTRGMGSCIGFDDPSEPGEVCGYDDNMKVKGKIIGLECMPVPTEFALLMNAYGGEEDEEPGVCVMLDQVELIEPDGTQTPQDGIMALPLRASGTTQLDKIIYREKK